MLRPTDELKDRVDAKRHEIEGRIAELKADTRNDAREQLLQLQTKLDDLQNMLKLGWEHVTDNAALRINEWLKN